MITRSGFQPYAVAVYETGNKVLIADNSSGNLYFFDGSTHAELGSVAVGKSICAMVVDETSGKLYAASNAAHKIAVVDITTNTLTGLMAATYTNYPRLSLDPGLGKVYALSMEGLTQIDIATGNETVIAGFGAPNTFDTMAVNPATHELFVARYSQNSLEVIDGNTHSRISYPNLGGLGVGVNWAENKAYVAKGGGSGIPFWILDRDTGNTTTAYASNDATEFLYIPGSNRMYTDSEVNGKSTIIEGGTDTFYNLPLPQTFTAMDVRRSTGHIYMAGRSSIAVLDDASQLVEMIPVLNPSPSSVIVQSIAINQSTGRVYTINDANALSFVTVVQDQAMMTRPPVYLGSKSSWKTHVFDPVSQSLVDKWTSYPGHGDAVRPGGGRLYEATYQSAASHGQLRTYAGNGGSTLLNSMDTGGIYPTVPVVTPDASRIYVTNSSSGNVSVIDTATNSLITTITTDSTPWGAAITPDGTHLYVANRGVGKVSVIDTASNSVVATINVGRSPWGVVISPSGTRAYVANSGDANVSVIEIASATVLTTVSVGTSPHWLAITPDGQRVFVGNRDSASVSVIDTASNTIVQTVPAIANPEGIAVLPDNSQVLVVSSNLSAASSLAVIDATTYEVSNFALPSDSMETIPLAIADPTAKFAGRVTANGAALANAQVRALQFGVQVGAALSNAIGDYSIFNLRPGAYDLEVSAVGYATQTLPTQSALTGRTTITSFAMIAAVPLVDLSPDHLTFAAQLVGTTSPAQQAVLHNAGNADLVISSIVAGKPFNQTNNCPSSLSSGATCTIQTTFRPGVKGPLTGSLTIADNAAGSPHAITLSGTGTVVALSPAARRFGAVQVGHTSATMTATLKNYGAKVLTITAISITGTNPMVFRQTNNCPMSPATLPAAETCTFSLTFKPTSKGAKSANLSVSDNGGGSPHKVTLAGTGT